MSDACFAGFFEELVGVFVVKNCCAALLCTLFLILVLVSGWLLCRKRLVQMWTLAESIATGLLFYLTALTLISGKHTLNKSSTSRRSDLAIKL